MSVLSHVLVKKKKLVLLSKIRSLIIKVLFKSEWTFRSAILMVCGVSGSLEVCGMENIH